MPEVVDETAVEIDTEFAVVEPTEHTSRSTTASASEENLGPSPNAIRMRGPVFDSTIWSTRSCGAATSRITPRTCSDTTGRSPRRDLPSVSLEVRPTMSSAARQPLGTVRIEDAPTEPPVDEPPADEPPVDEPVPDEPPAEEPPAYDPPVQDPPAEEPPSEETPPMWVRAAIEKVARSRQERPAAPRPARYDMRGPVFEISEEPERELAAETTTLSDIARGARVVHSGTGRESRALGQEAGGRRAAEEIEAGWEEEETAPPESFAPAAHRPEPPTCLRRRRSSTPRRCSSQEAPPAIRGSGGLHAAAAAAEPEPPPAVRAFHSRTDRDRNRRRLRRLRAARWPIAPLKSASRADRFFKIAATLVLVVGGLARSRVRRLALLLAASARRGRSSSSPRRPVRRSRSTALSEGRRRVTLELPSGSHEIALTRRGHYAAVSLSQIRPGEQTTQTLDWSQVRRPDRWR